MSLKKNVVNDKVYYYIEKKISFLGRTKTFDKYVGQDKSKYKKLEKEMQDDIFQEIYIPFLDFIKENNCKGLPDTELEKLIHNFSIAFTYESNKIEGSTITMKETHDLIEYNITPKKKPLHDVLETEGHNNAFKLLIDSKLKFNLSNVLYVHKHIFQKSRADIAGKIRNTQVLISGSKYIPPFPLEIYPLLEELFVWYEHNKELIHPVVLAALVHLKLVAIHPFRDGNGRVSRQFMNSILHQAGYPMLNIKYVNRYSYYNALEASHTRGEDNSFVVWFVKKYIKEFYSKDLKRNILRILVNRGLWDIKHTVNLVTLLPHYLREGKDVQYGLNQLLKKNWIIHFSKKQENIYSLNSKYKKEIMAFIYGF